MQGSKFFGFYKRELIDEVDEVLKAGIQVSLGAEEHDVLEVSVVDVRVNAEESLEDHLNDGLKVPWERYTKCTREDLLVVELVLYPCHQKVDILARTHFQRRLYIVAIGPEVLILWACRHRRARFSRAKLSQDAI